MNEHEGKLVLAECLRDQPLQFKRYSQWSEEWNHDHCVACGATFSELEGLEHLHEGWATTDAYDLGAEYDWLCQACVQELQLELGLTVVSSDEEAAGTVVSQFELRGL